MRWEIEKNESSKTNVLKFNEINQTKQSYEIKIFDIYNSYFMKFKNI